MLEYIQHTVYILYIWEFYCTVLVNCGIISSIKCCFCFQVYRSNRTLASIPSSSVSHMSKDLRLAKVKH